MRKRGLLILFLFMVYFIVDVMAAPVPGNAGSNFDPNTNLADQNINSQQIADQVNGGFQPSDSQMQQIANRPDFNDIRSRITNQEMRGKLDQIKSGLENLPRNIPQNAEVGPGLIRTATSILTNLRPTARVDFGEDNDEDLSFEDSENDLQVIDGENVEYDGNTLKIGKAERVRCQGTESHKVVNLNCFVGELHVAKATLVLIEGGAVSCPDVKNSDFKIQAGKLIEAHVESGKEKNKCSFFNPPISGHASKMEIECDAEKGFDLKYRTTVNGYNGIEVRNDKGCKTILGKIKFVPKEYDNKLAISDILPDGSHFYSEKNGHLLCTISFY